MIRRFSGLMAAVVLLTTAVIGLAPAPAHAAYCSGSGVGVVVDFGALGGGVTQGCGSGSKASTAFAKAGVSLEQDSRQSGFVCRVQGKPSAGQECLATNAYWALFVSKQGGAWKYASQGVYTQPVKNGDSIAFVWQDSNGRTAPGTAPQPLAATPTAPTSAATTAPVKPKPSSKPRATKAPKPTASASSSAPASSATATASASSTPTTASSAPASASSTPTAATSAPMSASSAPTAATSTVTDEDEPAQTGLPGWVGPLLVVALVGIATAVLLVRKRAPKAP